MVKSYFILVFLIFICWSCSRIENSMGFTSGNSAEFEAYELSFENVFLSNFSVKFTDSDTVFMQYNSVETQLKDSIQPQTFYYALVSKKDRNDLVEFLETAEFAPQKIQFDEEKIARGLEYRVYFKKDEDEYYFTLNELDKAPKNLDSLVHKTLRILPKPKELIKYSKTVNFKSKITTPPAAPEFEVDSANFD